MELGTTVYIASDNRILEHFNGASGVIIATPKDTRRSYGTSYYLVMLHERFEMLERAGNVLAVTADELAVI